MNAILNFIIQHTFFSIVVGIFLVVSILLIIGKARDLFKDKKINFKSIKTPIGDISLDISDKNKTTDNSVEITTFGLFLNSLKSHYDNFNEHVNGIQKNMYKKQIEAAKNEIKIYIKDLMDSIKDNNFVDSSRENYKLQLELYKYWLEQELYELFDIFEDILKTKCVAKEKLDDFDMVIEEAMNKTFDKITLKLDDSKLPAELDAFNQKEIEASIEDNKKDYRSHIEKIMKAAKTLAMESYAKILQEKENLDSHISGDLQTSKFAKSQAEAEEIMSKIK